MNEDDLYQAMDWLLTRKGAIETQLAQRHLEEGSLVLCDVTSTYLEGEALDLAFGYSRELPYSPSRPRKPRSMKIEFVHNDIAAWPL